MREIRGWNVGEVVTANYMTLNTANIMEEIGADGQPNLPCIYNGLTLLSQTGTGNSIVTFNPGVCRTNNLPLSTYTYLPSNAYGNSYPCFIDISNLDTNTSITLLTSPTSGYIVATFSISPNTGGAVNYIITGSLTQIATGSYNPDIHVRLCAYSYAASTFTLDFTPGTSRDCDLTGPGGIQWNYGTSTLEVSTPQSQTGSNILVKQNTLVSGTLSATGAIISRSASGVQLNNSGNTFSTTIKGGPNVANTTLFAPITDGSAGQFMQTNGSSQLSFAFASNSANVSANDSNVVFTSSDKPTQVCNPTAARTYKLPTTGILAGNVWTFYNRSTTDANIITLQSSGANTIDYCIANGWLSVVALVNTPTAAADWLVIDAGSGIVAYTPTFGTGWGTTTHVNFWYYRNRKFQIMNGYFSSGTIASATPSVSFGGGFSIDTTYIDTTSGGWQLGVYSRLPGGTGAVWSANGLWSYDGSNANSMRYCVINSSQRGNAVANPSGTVTNGDSIGCVNIVIPISGWN